MSLKGRSCWVVNIRMVRAEELSLEAIGRFVAASEEVQFEAEDRRQLYGWVEQVLVGRQYAQLGNAARGLVRRYIEKMTGLSRAQITRLIACYTASGRVQATVYRRRRFTQLYTRADIELLSHRNFWFRIHANKSRLRNVCGIMVGEIGSRDEMRDLA